jgi:hypothetical protein
MAAKSAALATTEPVENAIRQARFRSDAANGND